MKGQITIQDYLDAEKRKHPGWGGCFRYLRHGPHELLPEVRERTRQYLEEYGVPGDFKWSKDSLACCNCLYYDGSKCCRGAHTYHREFGYLICDAFKYSCTERKPSTVGALRVLIKGLSDDAYCPACGKELDELKEKDCEWCSECGAKLDWAPWHWHNDGG